MPLKFEKVDDILTDERREELMSNHHSSRERVKEIVIDLIDVAQNGKYDYRKGTQLFEAVVDINDALNSMADALYEYGTSYVTLLEKYSKNIQRLAELE